MAIEILAPAGDAVSFNAALNAGANAIYIGLKEFSARGNAENFSTDNLEDYLKKAHFLNVKVYVAVNTLIKNSEINDFLRTVSSVYSSGVDAFIVQDIFLGKLIKEKYPDLCLHLSTQAGTCNVLGAQLAKEYGFSRVVLARETVKEDIAEIAKIIETEVFVQGALCSSFSGHCYMSSFVGGLSGNRGYCKQPCRKKYTYSGEGFKPFSGYNLSLSDLCLKEQVKELAEMGVSSIKIEGRMRSPEYVFAAVSVYKEALNEGRINENSFADLKRTFNRGDYTTGYFYMNTRDIISSKIQGNIGDFVGYINKCDKDFAYVKTSENFVPNDGFKITRKGFEVAGGNYAGNKNGILKISVSAPVAVGDEVRITKDVALADRLLSFEKKIEVRLSVVFKPEKKAECRLVCGENIVTVYSDVVFMTSNTHPLLKEDVEKCFSKVDDKPILPVFESIECNGVFAPKSVLNAFRRKCFEEIFSMPHRQIKPSHAGDFLLENNFTSNIKKDKNIVIITDFVDCDYDGAILVYKPKDYRMLDDFYKFKSSLKNEVYLYLPPFASGADLAIIEQVLPSFNGVYSEGLYGLQLAKEYRVNLICGTGFNVFNDYDVYVLGEVDIVKGFVYSKELSVKEISGILSGGYVFSCGDIQLMDLIYCPFSFSCEKCNRGNVYELKDESGRIFHVRRYRVSACRFEVYNPYKLVSDFCQNGAVYDFSFIDNKIGKKVYVAKNVEQRKALLPEYTYGNLVKGVK